MKRFIKKLFLPFLVSRPVSELANRLLNCGAPIFMLHRIAQPGQPEEGKISTTHLRQCIEYLLKHGYHFMSLEQLILALNHNQRIPPSSAVFTIDDGYVDQAELATPIFLEYECPVTFFVITGMLDQTIMPWDAQVSWIIESSHSPLTKNSVAIRNLDLRFDSKTGKRELRRAIQNKLKMMDYESVRNVIKQLAQDAGVSIPKSCVENHRPMTWDMARQLEHRGIQFAPHSVSHNILSRLNQEMVDNEICDSWTTIDEQLSNPLKVFCYPNGQEDDFGQREMEILRNNGFLGAVTTIPGFVKSNDKSNHDIYSLPRIALPDNMTEFIQYCSWIEHIRSN